MFRGRDTVEMLEVLLKENMLGDAAIVSSFGAESAVLLHLIASIDRDCAGAVSAKPASIFLKRWRTATTCVIGWASRTCAT